MKLFFFPHSPWKIDNEIKTINSNPHAKMDLALMLEGKWDKARVLRCEGH